MKKISSLKTWYSIEEASIRVSKNLNQEISENDLLRLVLENKISIFLHGGKYLCEPCEKIDSSMSALGHNRNNISFNGQIVYFIREHLKLEIHENLEYVDYINSIISTSPTLVKMCNPLFISNFDGDLFIIIEKKSLGLEEYMHGIPNKTFDKKDCLPRRTFPEISNLGFTRKELDKFEINNAIEKPEDQRQINNLLRTVYGFAKHFYKYDPKSVSTKVYKDISDMLDGRNIIYDEVTIEKWLIAASKLSKQAKAK